MEKNEFIENLRNLISGEKDETAVLANTAAYIKETDQERTGSVWHFMAEECHNSGARCGGLPWTHRLQQPEQK